MSDFDELAVRFSNQAKELHNEAVNKIRELFLEAKAAHPEIIYIEYSGEPNSYSDEGYSCEGKIEVHTPELDELNKRVYGKTTYYDYYDDSEGVWSEDDENGSWDEEKNHPMTVVAKELFQQVHKLQKVVGYNGYFSIKV
jgi:hypothetical protein